MRPIVLLVEDHVDTRQMYAEFMTSSYEVLEAGTGTEALEVMSSQTPHIIVTDVSLPDIDGFELIARMRQDPRLAAVPVICLSGYGGHAHEERAREVRCDRLLQKPCLPDSLSSAVADVLSTPQRPPTP
jgi:chemosensory pili system protein ChpA (sensor histidine kinase/response regulator)